MKSEYLPIRALLAGVLGISVGGFACSDSGTDGSDENGGSGGLPVAGTAGSGLAGRGGMPAAAGQPGAGGASGKGGSSAVAGGAPGTGGSLSGTGGGATGGGAGAAGLGTGGGAGGSLGGGADAGAGGMGGMATAGAGAGGAGSGSGGKGGAGGSGGAFTGTCTESKSTGKSGSGTGPYDVVIETNSEAGIKCGTIYRPADLGGDEKYPILVWGEGACSQNGLSNQAAMSEIASWGYFIVADGTPGGDNACQSRQNGAAFLDYITWAIAENDKPCSAYYQSLEPTKIAADGFSCGGLMAENASDDPRFTAIGITSSGLMGGNAGVYEGIHTPFKIMNGGPSDVAYQNGLNDYEEISSRGIPIVYFAKTSAGHGGDLGQGRGDFNRVNLAWLNWQLKGDEGATGKAFLHGPTCEFCSDSGWEYKAANID